MRKLIISLIALSAVTVASAQEQVYYGYNNIKYVVTVNTENVNLRKLPDATSGKLTEKCICNDECCESEFLYLTKPGKSTQGCTYTVRQANKGESYGLLEEQGDWCQLCVPMEYNTECDGCYITMTEPWVMTKFLTKEKISSVGMHSIIPYYNANDSTITKLRYIKKFSKINGKKQMDYKFTVLGKENDFSIVWCCDVNKYVRVVKENYLFYEVKKGITKPSVVENTLMLPELYGNNLDGIKKALSVMTGTEILNLVDADFWLKEYWKQSGQTFSIYKYVITMSGEWKKI